MSVDLHTGDCREIMPALGPFDMIVADPPYGDTSLSWDRRVVGWLQDARLALKPSGSMWIFGSMRALMLVGQEIRHAGWRYAQDIVWEKHNGSNAHQDRFRRVHEHAVQVYHDDALWSGVYNDLQTTPDATARTVRRKKRAPHWGPGRESGHYVSEDGGPRIMRSVIYMRSAHGRAIHPTEKPASLIEILIRTSCPEGGLVGDWFAGSASAGEACQMSGRNYVGCEIDAAMAEAARARLSANLFGAAVSQ